MSLKVSSILSRPFGLEVFYWHYHLVQSTFVVICFSAFLDQLTFV